MAVSFQDKGEDVSGGLVSACNHGLDVGLLRSQKQASEWHSLRMTSRAPRQLQLSRDDFLIHKQSLFWGWALTEHPGAGAAMMTRGTGTRDVGISDKAWNAQSTRRTCLHPWWRMHLAYYYRGCATHPHGKRCHHCHPYWKQPQQQPRHCPWKCTAVVSTRGCDHRGLGPSSLALRLPCVCWALDWVPWVWCSSSGEIPQTT